MNYGPGFWNWDYKDFGPRVAAVWVPDPGDGWYPAAVLANFSSAYPGESGTRNPLRGDGYFGIDTGLSKYFRITERTKVQLRWETFNITNTVRYDVHTIGNRLDQPTPFGKYTQTITNPRVMQFALRLEF